MNHRIALAAIALAAALASAGPANAAGDPAAAHRHVNRNYAVMGDSITAGIGTSDWIVDADGKPVVRVSNKWGYAEQAHVRAFGVGGACIVGTWCKDPALVWWPAAMRAARHRPSTVVADIGINDLLAGFTAEDVIAGLRKLRREGRELGVRVVFGTITPSPADNALWNVTQPERLRVNMWIRSTQPSYVDYAAVLEGVDGWLQPKYEGPMRDVHVGDTGAAAMATVLRDWIYVDEAPFLTNLRQAAS